MFEKGERKWFLLALSVAVWIVTVVPHFASAKPHIEDELEEIKEELGLVFTNTIPSDYYKRKNLQDCHSRFHQRVVNEHRMAVFNGTSVNPTEFPHMAVLGWTTTLGTIDWKCGGSLITERYVLTAAHCSRDRSSDNNKPPDVVRLGDVNLKLTTDDHYAQQIKVRRVIKHPEYNPRQKYNDLALVELEQKVEITPGVCPACIWSKQVYPYDWFEVAGFGYKEYGGQGSSDLLKARLTLVNATDCAAAYPAERGLPEGIRADQLCAASPYSDTCQGDSGGPLQTSLFSYQHIVHFLIGVTSFGKFCGHGAYGVYQKVQPHLNWIRSVVKDSLDPIECIQKYKNFLEPTQMTGETEAVDPYFSRVYLHWNDSSTDVVCGGTLVDYNVVITSAHCTFNSRGEPPARISIIDRWANIIEIERHNRFKQGSYYNDVALIRIDRYIAAAKWIVPVCLPYASSLQGYQISPETFSCRTPKAPYPGKLQIYLPSKTRCDEQAITNDIEYSSKFPQGLGNAMSCFDTDYRLVPDLAEIDRGGPLLSHDETIIIGVNAYGTDCGSYNPLITTNVAPLIPWIEQFVFRQTAEISKPEQATLTYEDKTLYVGSTCSTKDGKTGSCALTVNCGKELTRYKSREVEPTVCGFLKERVIICCPT